MVEVKTEVLSGLFAESYQAVPCVPYRGSGPLRGFLDCAWLLAHLGGLEGRDSVVDSSNGEVLDDDGCCIHGKIDDKGYSSRVAIDEGDEEWTKELAEQVNPAHLGVNMPQSLGVPFSNNDNLEACQDGHWT